MVKDGEKGRGRERYGEIEAEKERDGGKRK